MAQQHDLGLYFHGAAVAGIMTMRSITLAVIAIALFWAQAGHAQEVINPRKADNNYSIGPYPVPLNVQGVSTTIYVSLIFTPEIRPTQDPQFKLTMQAWAELTQLGPSIRSYLKATHAGDNCERINNIDNWTHEIGEVKLAVVDPHTLRIKLHVDSSAWTCTEGVPETVCAGLSCKLRPTTYKVINFTQGGEVHKDTWVDVKEDQLLYKSFEPEVDLDNNTVLQNLLNDGMKTALKLDDPVERNKLLPATAIDIATPDAFKAFHPRLEQVVFEVYKDHPFLRSTYSVGINQSQINDFMSRYFGSLYTPVHILRANAQPAPALTKSSVRADCVPYMTEHPSDTIEHCAAMMGLPYEGLPD